jgi:hypothetical protein
VAGEAGGDAELDEALRDVLRQRSFQWRLPRAEPAGGDGEAAGAVRGFAEWLGGAVEYMMDSWAKWMRELTSSSGGGGGRVGGTGLFGAVAAMTALEWVLVAAVVVALALVVVYLLRARAARRARAAAAAGGAASPPEIDLEADSVQADALEEDAWLALAQEKVSAGEYRLAVRAVFLACLSHLAERKLVRLRRSKSNRDYARELAMRAHGAALVRQAFGDGIAVFERTWYGDHPATASEVEAMRSNFQQMAGA